MPNPPRDTTAGRVFNDLRNLARRSQRATDEIMLAYVLERFLYRLSVISPDRFVLKGGMLLAMFDARRTTRDIDLLGRGVSGDHDEIRALVGRIAGTNVDDGVTFDTGDIRTATIREDAEYLGVRVTLPAAIARARLKLSLDVNFGDPVTPAPQHIDFPQLLLSDTFPLLGYPVETVLAEKIVTAVSLGEANTRDRDYGDLYRLITAHDLSGADVIAALNRTAAHRGISLRPLSTSIPTLASRRQSSYSAWRRKQGRTVPCIPKTSLMS